MKTIIDVAKFHKACKIPTLAHPGVPSMDRQELRVKLIVEEIVEELIPAMGFKLYWNENTDAYTFMYDQEPDIVEIADAICDGIFVLQGAALEYGIPMDEIWDEVQRTNMAKTDGPVRDDGKIMKPEGWQPPDIKKILEKYAPKK